MWEREWEARTSSLFTVWQQCEAEGAGHCPALLEQIRDSRPLAESSPVPETRALAIRLLDAMWDAARILLYGDLEPAREHVSKARRLDREIRSRIQALPRDQRA